MSYFKTVFSEKIISHVAYCTDLYNTQTNIEKESTGVDKNEIERYIAVLFRMPIFFAHYYRLYWELDN